jgi:hypothetical protein
MVLPDRPHRQSQYQPELLRKGFPMTTDGPKHQDISLVSIVIAIWKQRLVACLISSVFIAFGVYLFVNTKAEFNLTFEIVSSDYSSLPHVKEWNNLVALLDLRAQLDTNTTTGELSFATANFREQNTIQPLGLLAKYHMLYSTKHKVRKIVRQNLEARGELSGKVLDKAIERTTTSISVGKIFSFNNFIEPNAMTVSIKTTDPLFAREIIEVVSTQISLEVKANLASQTAEFVNSLERSVKFAEDSEKTSGTPLIPLASQIVSDLQVTRGSLVAALPEIQVVDADFDFPIFEPSSKRYQLLLLFSFLGIFLGLVVALILQTIRQNIGNNAHGR